MSVCRRKPDIIRISIFNRIFFTAFSDSIKNMVFNTVIRQKAANFETDAAGTSLSAGCVDLNDSHCKLSQKKVYGKICNAFIDGADTKNRIVKNAKKLAETNTNAMQIPQKNTFKILANSI